jgi:hypothetical protein
MALPEPRKLNGSAQNPLWEWLVHQYQSTIEGIVFTPQYVYYTNTAALYRQGKTPKRYAEGITMPKKADKPATSEGRQLICRPFIRLKDGRIIWAKDYGRKAFCFYVD